MKRKPTFVFIGTVCHPEFGKINVQTTLCLDCRSKEEVEKGVVLYSQRRSVEKCSRCGK